ncbi:MAG: hypothetical protein Q8R30_04825 [bacterium]|nr:hypothetical protein [bacterium]MDZ4286291.1 hypothetical protein [Candidatus Sungbacteria bacterium]
MEDWQKEIDQHLLPHGALFSKEAIGVEFIKEIRRLTRSARLPFFTAILLEDGAASWFYRIVSLIILIGCPLFMALAKPSRAIGGLFMILCVILSAPGWWMWSYCLLPLETKMESMMDLFKKKREKAQQKSSWD